ncbi:response regulator [Sphingobacterium sp.]|uniref:response regulator transcription factor n=1 Tax=Sphingobacterium sp. TaxID=341027 RepID=UPI002899C97E|nr:response regulator [Sphingobacterium sp.]
MRNKIKLAFVDDSTLQQIMLNFHVQKSRLYNMVFTCKNGLELLEKLERAKELPEICIIDLHMPIMGGKEVAKEISERFPTIKLFGYTASKDIDELNSFKRQGLLRVFKKENPVHMLKEIGIIIGLKI